MIQSADNERVIFGFYTIQDTVFTRNFMTYFNINCSRTKLQVVEGQLLVNYICMMQRKSFF